MMKCVMLLLLLESWSLPRVPTQLHIRMDASPGSHTPEDCKESQIFSMEKSVYVCGLLISTLHVDQLGRFLSLQRFKIEFHPEADWGTWP